MNLFAITWTDGASGNALDTGAWNGSTYSDGVDLTINNGTVYVLSDNILIGTNNEIYIGNNGSTQGNLNLLGGNLTYDDIIPGNNGSGNFNIYSGNIVVRRFDIGNNSGSTGNVTMFNGNLLITERLYIGDGTSGNFAFYNGNLHSQDDVRVANSASSSGNLIVYGGNISVDDDFYVAQDGIGYAIINGGNISVPDDFFVGDNGTGVLEMNGGYISSQSFFLANNPGGNGTLNMNGGNIITTGSLRVPDNATGNGLLNMRGGNLSLGNELAFYAGNGTMHMTGGQITAEEIFLSRNEGGISSAIIDNGVINLSNDVILSNASNTISNLTINGGEIFVNDQFLTGQNANATSANITMNNGFIKINDDMHIGNNSHGNMVMNGGNIVIFDDFRLSNVSSSSAHLVFTQGNISSSEAYFPYNGDGLFEFNSGTFHVRNDLYLSQAAGSTGNVYIHGGNLVVSDEVIVTDNDTSSANLIMTDGFISFDDLFLGDEGNGYMLMTGGNIYGLDNFRVGRNSTSAYGNLLMKGGLIDVDDFFIGTNDQSKGYVHLTGGNIFPRNDFNLAQNSGSYGELLLNGGVINADDLIIGDSGNAHFVMRSGLVSLEDDIIISENNSSSANFHYYGGEIVGIDDIHVGNGGSGNFVVYDGTLSIPSTINVGLSSGANGQMMIYGGNINAANLIISNTDSGTCFGNLHLSQGNVQINENFQVGQDDFGFAKISGGNLSTADTRIGAAAQGNLMMTGGILNSDELHIGYTTGTDGNLIISGGEINSSTLLNIARGGNGLLVVKGGTINANDVEISNTANSEGNLNFIAGNINISGTLNIDQNDSIVRIYGGANLQTDLLTIPNNNMKWEHFITKTTGRYDNIGLAYIESGSTLAEGDLDIGVESGLLLNSSDNFFLQVGATQAGADNYDSKPNMWDISLEDNVDGTRDAIMATLGSGNRMANFDMNGTKEALMNNTAAGWISIENLDPVVQTGGIYVYLNLENANTSSLINNFIAMGYQAETTSLGGHDLRLIIPPSHFESGTTYLLYDFRELSTGQTDIRVNEIQVDAAPIANGTIFKLR